MATELLDELKQLLIDGLHLEDITPDDIDPEAALFGEGLGLDSIDALEIAVILDKQYGVRVASDDERNPEIFATLASLTAFVEANRSQ